MGSSPSKPVTGFSASEKSTSQDLSQSSSSSSSKYVASSLSSHHASDRILKISTEAALTRSNSPESNSNRHRKINMPAHETSHSEINLNALKAWDAIALDDPTSRLAAMTIHNNVIRDSIRRRTAETADHHVFSHTIPGKCSRKSDIYDSRGE
jgi:hypothetical protein